MLQRVTDGGNSSLELHGKAECEKAKGQMKEEAFILFPVSLYSLLLNVYHLSIFTIRGITKSTLESFVRWPSLLKSNQSLNQKKAICIKFEWYSIILHIIVDQQLSQITVSTFKK